MIDARSGRRFAVPFHAALRSGLGLAMVAGCVTLAGAGCGGSNEPGADAGTPAPTQGQTNDGTGGASGSTSGSNGSPSGSNGSPSGTTAGTSSGSDKPGTTGGTTGNPGGVDHTVDKPTWTTCLDPYGKPAELGIPFLQFKLDECASVPVPLDWSKPKGDKIDVYIGRKKSKKANAPQVWFLQGGPGGSAGDMIAPMAILNLFGPADVDFYFLEHRGVGASARLGCPTTGEATTSEQGANVTAAEWPACLTEMKQKWTEAGLKQFNTTNAGHDLAAVIQATKAAGQKVFVYGVSYGTYWAHRYAQVTNEPPTGLILDSMVPAEGQYLSDFERQFDPVGKRLAELCATQDICKQRFPGDAWKAWSTLLTRQRTEEVCKGTQFEPGDLRTITAVMLQQNVLNNQIPALLYKFQRCSAEDVKSLNTFVENLMKLLGGQGLLAVEDDAGKFSQGLYENVAFGELWPTPAPTKADLAKDIANAVIGTGGALEQADLYDTWPRYDQDGYVRKWMNKPISLLMLNGTLDVQTPIETAELYKTQFTSGNQTFVRVPNGNHGIIFQSQTSEQRSPFCGSKIIGQFVTNETAKLDVSCATKVLPPDFKGNAQINQQLWGTGDIWALRAPTPEEARAAFAKPVDAMTKKALEDFARALRRRVPTFAAARAHR